MTPALYVALDAYGPLVRSIARTYCRAQHDAEDAVQEAFVKVWRAAPKYDARVASEPAFVATVARNAVIDYRRRRPKEATTDFSTTLPKHAGPHPARRKPESSRPIVPPRSPPTLSVRCPP